MTGLEFELDNFMLYCTSRNLSKKTLASYEQALKLFCNYLQEHFNIVDANNVQSGHIRQYIKYLQDRGKYTVVSREQSKQSNFPNNRTDHGKQVSMITIANYVRNIKVFFNWLHDERGITNNPVAKVAIPKIERKMKTLLTPEQLKKVLAQFETTTFTGYRNWMITRLLLDTGCRISECLSIQPEHIDFNHKSILIVNPKNKQERYVYFSFKLSGELKSWLKYHDRYSNSLYLFPTIRGTQLDIRGYERALKQAGANVGVQIHPHQLRNNFAKYYILNGGDWFSLCRILGHSSVEVTQKSYADFSDLEVGKKYQQHSPLSTMDI
ncbi:tyrosine-type recombinase/integrase [Paenibacillus bouchesdurhonensis]|uniref:tyrosine-type recombinase/integrase n=1 Tax=Paenibacillus bouchesdurhonensis TaxID=1870990 RepID=UPI003898F14B